MTDTLRYDDALPRFAALLAEVVGEDHVREHLFLRDGAGRLTLVVQAELEPEAFARLETGAEDLVPWVEGASAVVRPDDLFDDDVQDPDAGLPEYLDAEPFTGFVRLLERRIVGQDWLEPPRDPIAGAPPIVVFASHKGGVGRSTALSVATAAVSKAGFNVLVIDLDLEAPGLGDMLLAEAPRFGTLDFYVEDGVADLNAAFIEDLVAPSPAGRGGVVHVAPAVGAVAAKNPQNVLGKISRAYLERAREDGEMETFLDRTRRLVQRLTERLVYDVIFIDARAGLNEATAGAMLGLGAEVLLFGVDTPQTFSGYAYLLSHLARFRPSTSGDDDWRYRLRMVHAKSQADPEAQAAFRTQAFEVFSETLYDEEVGIEEAAFNFDYDDLTAPHYAWPILNDANYSEFNPLARGDQFSEPVYARTFGPFISALGEKIGLKL